MNLPPSRRPATDTLYDSIRERILIGALPPGMELRQEILARQYGVSRVPMREALSRLQAEGLIVLRPRRGFAVAALDLAEIVEIFELRMVLEQHALETAARLRSEADVARAEAILLRLEALDLSEAHIPAWLNLNREFHATLIASARRQRLIGIACTLRDTIEPYIRMEFDFGQSLDEVVHQHRALFEAFRDRAAERAGRISRDHCIGAMNRLLASVRAREAMAKPPAKTRAVLLKTRKINNLV